MKKLLLTFAILLMASPAAAQLIITGVMDGPLSGGVPKLVELYACDDIPDLSIYGLGCANNGGGTDGVEFTFPADAMGAGTYIYVESLAATNPTAFFDYMGFSPNYDGGFAVGTNGDDAIELFYVGGTEPVVVDVFGDINADGTGLGWDYLDGWVKAQLADMPHLKYVPVVSDALPEDQWQGRTGFVHRAVLEDLPDLSGHQVYACGAPVVVDSARKDYVEKAGLPEEEFYADAFTTEADKARAAT